MYASAQALDFLVRTKNTSFPNRKLQVSHPVFSDGHKLWCDPGGGGRSIPGAVIACARFPMIYNPAKLWGIGSAFDRTFPASTNRAGAMPLE